MNIEQFFPNPVPYPFISVAGRSKARTWSTKEAEQVPARVCSQVTGKFPAKSCLDPSYKPVLDMMPYLFGKFEEEMEILEQSKIRNKASIYNYKLLKLKQKLISVTYM